MTHILSFSQYRGNLISPMRNFLSDVFIMSPMRITRKFSSNDKLRISMSPNISLGLCLQSIVVKVAGFFDKFL